MKIKTSITLSRELMQDIDHFSKPSKNRSEFIETAVRSFITQLIRNRQNAQDLEIINQNADHLNDEAHDVLSYQVRL